jgi:hypothetical protein
VAEHLGVGLVHAGAPDLIVRTPEPWRANPRLRWGRYCKKQEPILRPLNLQLDTTPAL